MSFFTSRATELADVTVSISSLMLDIDLPYFRHDSTAIQ